MWYASVAAQALAAARSLQIGFPVLTTFLFASVIRSLSSIALP